MEFKRMTDSLERLLVVLPVLVESVVDDDLRWKPASGNWSILEIVCHLGDEEVEDFRTRVRMTLSEPSTPWPSIDPEGVAVERSYNRQEFATVLRRFLKERETSLRFLRSLVNPNWNTTHHSETLGPLRAGDIMASWVVHDLLHLRQIVKRMFEINQRDAGQFRTDYAGDWTA